MVYKFEFRHYRRKFLTPLITSHGVWENRDGVILYLKDEVGKVGWGEISPISWFGSESLSQAILFCQELANNITDETIDSIPDELPACQFGFESAREMIQTNNSFTFQSHKNLTCSGLLPAGKAALNQWQKLWEDGTDTFKWKIGVYPIESEISIFELLIRELPAFTKLRLDANGGLSYGEAEVWLQKCDDINIKTDVEGRRKKEEGRSCDGDLNPYLEVNDDIHLEIEFLEQPLSVKQFWEMLELSRLYTTKIALDESVATLKQLQECYHKGWREIFVIKAGIIGFPSRLRQFCLAHKIDTVFSSVLETCIGREAALLLAAELSPQKRAVGFGVNHFFVEDEQIFLDNLWTKISSIS